MKRFSQYRLKRQLIWLSVLFLVWLLCSGEAIAGPLSDRLARFPNWQGKPPTAAATGDLVYPDWLAGEWEMTTTLVDLAAPLAPELETPGFESNRAMLNQAIACRVRFEPRLTSLTQSYLLQPRLARTEVVSDRAFNGLNLARAYLGEQAVQAVKVDPQNPNRQVTLLRGDRQLESTVTARATETPDPDTFVTTELFQQVFRGLAQPYLNEVETTTAYHHIGQDPPAVEAEQVTAIYLSPQDPDYFKAGDRPVALYRYRLTFTPAMPLATHALAGF
ncbi:MAG: hypothetical protein IGR92_08395 [Leptolyngbyaceae cyanobacterium T60_A2020_046]|nr:hypothetical protein [Leptolyngbyaceae cyanobacterium T60_A2020_046]